MRRRKREGEKIRQRKKKGRIVRSGAGHLAEQAGALRGLGSSSGGRVLLASLRRGIGGRRSLLLRSRCPRRDGGTSGSGSADGAITSHCELLVFLFGSWNIVD